MPWSHLRLRPLPGIVPARASCEVLGELRLAKRFPES